MRYMDEKLLVSLGLQRNEIRVFRAIASAGEVTPVALERATGIKRTSCYSVARSLAEKGIVVEHTTKRPRTFSPAAAADIDALVEEEKRRFGEREGTLRAVAKELARAKAQKSYPVPQIRFIEEEKLEQFLYKQAGAWWSSMLHTDTTWWGFQDHTFVDHYAAWIDWTWKDVPNAIDLKLLSNRSEAETNMEGKYPRRAIKFWDKGGAFASTTWVVGDYVVMINTRTKPFYLVEIHDKRMANDQREIFKNLWPLVA